MGFHISWLACKGKEPQWVQQQLGCSATGQFGQYAQSPLVGRPLPSGWYVLVANRCDHAIVSDPVLSAISSGCSVVACSIEEHVMYCAASFWSSAGKIWSVAHRGDEAASDLTVTGNPPAEFAQIRQTFADKQATESTGKFQVDWFFEIPLELAQRIAGFKHDQDNPGVAHGSFAILRADKNGLLERLTRPWWQFW